MEARGFEPRSAVHLPIDSFTGLVPLVLDLRTGLAIFFTNIFASSSPILRLVRRRFGPKSSGPPFDYSVSRLPIAQSYQAAKA
jgi:hypothetical protein